MLIDNKQSEDIRKELHIKGVITRINDYQIKLLEYVERTNSNILQNYVNVFTYI